MSCTHCVQVPSADEIETCITLMDRDTMYMSTLSNTWQRWANQMIQNRMDHITDKGGDHYPTHTEYVRIRAEIIHDALINQRDT